MALSKEDQTRLDHAASIAFTPAAPINARNLFAGRKEQVRQVIDAINQVGQHAIVFGERGVGKTSLSNVLKYLLEDQRISYPIFAPHIICDGTDNFHTAWIKAFKTIREMGEDRKIKLPRIPILEAIEQASELFPPEIELTPDTIRRNLSLVGENIFLIVIIDEFDRINDPDNQRLFADTIKALSDRAVYVTVILVGVADSVDQLIKEHQSVERALMQVQLPRMSEDEIHEIIYKGLERLDEMKIDRAALAQISLLAKGLPVYAHLLGLHSAREAIDRGDLKVELADVMGGLENALKQAQQSTRSAYHKATMSQRSDSLHREVLLACAMAKTDELGYFSATDVRGPLSQIKGKPYDTPNFAKHLAHFCEEDRGPILEKVRFKYRFINPLMQPYIVMDGFAKGLIKTV
ncbi:MAG: ATP-binding protein [Nitrospinota bacterium]